MGTYKRTNTKTLFLEVYQLEKLSNQGDPLARLNQVVDWDYFRSTVEKVHDKPMVGWGSKAYDPLLMRIKS